MSETIIRYLLSEVKTIRVVCKKCNGVIETPLDSAADALTGNMECRLCGADFEQRNNGRPRMNPLRELEAVSQALREMQGQVEVHFVFPADTNA